MDDLRKLHENAVRLRRAITIEDKLLPESILWLRTADAYKDPNLYKQMTVGFIEQVEEYMRYVRLTK